MNRETKNIAFIGVFIAMVVGLGYSLVLVPNVELVTAMIFLSGVLMGVKRGMIVGIVGEFIFSSINPVGSGLLFPPMLVAQVVAMGVVGATGGVLQNYIIKCEPKLRHTITIGIVGFILTFIYDAFVSLAFPIAAGFKSREILGVVAAGIAFNAVHLVANTAVFIILVPVAAKRVFEAVPYFSSLDKKQ